MNPRDIGSRLSQMVPAQESLTLISRSVSSGNDTTSSSTLPNCRRRPLDRKETLMVGASIGETWEKFQVYDPGVLPKVGDRVTDTNSVTYEVRAVNARSVHGVYNVICLKDR